MIVVSLPVADRRTAHAFYRDALGLEAIGAPASDGVPEPLQFPLADGVRLMLIPTGGFGWVIGDHDVAPPEQCECLLSRSAEDDAEVRAVIDKALAAGAAPVTAPGRQPWGYAGAFADPDGHVWMVTAEPLGE